MIDEYNPILTTSNYFHSSEEISISFQGFKLQRGYPVETLIDILSSILTNVKVTQVTI